MRLADRYRSVLPQGIDHRMSVLAELYESRARIVEKCPYIDGMVDEDGGVEQVLVRAFPSFSLGNRSWLGNCVTLCVAYDKKPEILVPKHFDTQALRPTVRTRRTLVSIVVTNQCFVFQIVARGWSSSSHP